MYFVTMDKTTHKLDIMQAPSGRFVASFERLEQATAFVTAATLRVAEFKREVADARHHLDKQLSVLRTQIKSQEG